MLEFLLALLFFAFAVVPLYLGSVGSSRAAHSVGRHLMASQIAQDLLEYLRGLPYEECRAEAFELQRLGSQVVGADPARRLWVVDDDQFGDMISAAAAGAGVHHGQQLHEDFAVSYRGMSYAVSVEEALDGFAANRVLLIRVTITYPVDDLRSDGISRQVTMTGLKMREDV